VNRIKKSELIKRYPVGEALDSDIAKKVGCSREYVRQVRESMGLSRPARKQYAPKTPEAVLNAIREMVGNTPDADIAKALGVSIATVAKQRREAGIKYIPYDRPWKKESLPLLGTMSDAKLGKRFNVPYATARRWRIKNDVAPWRFSR
jgi:transposase-like protein